MTADNPQRPTTERDAQTGWQSRPQTAAEDFERHWVPAIFRPWALELLEHAALSRDERVLDVACGTGIVARLAAERVGPAGSVTGLDLNPGMLAVARTVAASPGA